MIKSKNTTLTIPVNYFCNQKCIFCIDSNKAHLQYLSKETDFKVGEFLKQGQGKYDKVIFTFGEPTLNKNLNEYIKIAKQLGYPEIGIITNGTYLTQTLLHDFYLSGLSEITLSIHGSHSQLHDEMTGLKGSFIKVLSALLLIKKNYNTIVLNVSYVLNKFNLHDLNNFIVLAHKLGVNNIIINTMRLVFYGDNEHYNHLSIQYSDFIDYIKNLDSEQLQNINNLLDNKILRIMDIPICILQKAGLSVEGYGKLEIMVTNIRNRKIVSEGVATDDNNRFKKYIKKCLKCSYYGDCEGIYMKYLKIYGNKEF